jgi:hypothetical protein
MVSRSQENVTPDADIPVGHRPAPEPEPEPDPASATPTGVAPNVDATGSDPAIGYGVDTDPTDPTDPADRDPDAPDQDEPDPDDPTDHGPDDPGPGSPEPLRDFAELDDTGEGDGIIRVDVWGTSLFTLASVLAAVFPDALTVVSVPVALALFALGSLTLLWAYLAGIGRSRTQVVALGGLFFLGDDVAPARVRRALRALLAVQVVVAVAAAAARPFTELAFGVLVPVFGLGLMALWGARHGRFPAKGATA